MSRALLSSSRRHCHSHKKKPMRGICLMKSSLDDWLSQPSQFYFHLLLTKNNRVIMVLGTDA